MLMDGGIAQLVERCFCTADVSGSNPLISKNKIESTAIESFKFEKVKRIRAYDGYLGVQKRRRAWLPAIRFGELEASFDPKIPE